MFRSTGLILAAATAALLLGTAAQADTSLSPFTVPTPQTTAKPAIGVGVICDTHQQAEQFVSLRAAGKNVTEAMDTVDTGAPDPHACGFAAVAFVPGRTMGQKTVAGRLFAIVEIKVIAGLNSSGWHSTGNATQYAIMRAPGVEI